MKIQLDTVNKTITLEERVSIGELFTLLNNFFPDGDWKNYTLEVKVITNWINPLPIEPIPVSPLIPSWPAVPITPGYPWWPNPIITCEASVTNYNSGVYNLDYKK